MHHNRRSGLIVVATALALSILPFRSAGAAVPISAGGRPTSWKRLLPAASPTPRAAHAMAFDPVSGKVVLFGGYDATTYLSETWAFDGTTWTRESPPVSPPPRAAASMAYDAVTGQLVMFGGYDGTSYLGDTWT